MSYLKGLTSKDVIVSPLTVHKTYQYASISSKTLSLIGLAQFDGNEDTYITGSGTGSAPLVFNSIKQLYYGNYVNNPNGLLNTASRTQYNEDGTVEGPILNNLYENNISSINEIRKFPPASRKINVLTIPRAVCGDFIKPGSFDSLNFNEDGEGNLIKKSDSTKDRHSSIKSFGRLSY